VKSLLQIDTTLIFKATIYYRGFQLAARGPHVARQTIFVAREAFWDLYKLTWKLTPFSVQLPTIRRILFEKFCLLRSKFDRTAFLKIWVEGGLLLYVLMWPAKYLPM
jgi:hypothetical protein